MTRRLFYGLTPSTESHGRDTAGGPADRCGIEVSGLRLLSANHRIKVALAQRLRRETTMDLKWIAQELGIGSWKYLSNLLNREPRTSEQAEFAL